ncbi:MAG: ABC transporter ATP-binding protein [Gammaproteobacteria bacterium]
MIEAQNLSMRFGEHEAIPDLTFSIKPGTVVGFLGPNGAGKTTTMRLLTGFYTPASGTARICGYDIRRKRRRAQKCFGYLPEAAGGFANLTAREFLTVCAQARGIRRASRHSRIERVANMTALTPALDRRMKTLSKGWRQRAWFAQTLLHDPPVLILDEPTDGLDPNQKRLVRALIRALAPDKAILLSTHILEEAEEVCDRAIIIAGGRKVADDTPANLADAKGRLSATFHDLTGSAGTERC